MMTGASAARVPVKAALNDAQIDEFVAIGRRLWAFYTWCADTDVPELHTLAQTIQAWWPAVEVFLTTGITNARTEGTNRLVKQVKRAACGFRNRRNYRTRVRLLCTRSTRRITA